MKNIIFKAKQALLELKQKFPPAFQDICLYSEVSKCLGRNTYRLVARRLIQEIFLDLNFAAFQSETDQILDHMQVRLQDVQLPLTTEQLSDNITTHNVQVHTNQPQSTSGAPHTKLHAIKSPQLASVYETSIENLVEVRLEAVDEVDSTVILRSDSRVEQGEILVNRHSSVSETLQINENASVRRKRFNTLELDLSCTRNKFPISERRKKDFSPTEVAGVTAKEDENSNTSLSSNNSLVNLNKSKDKGAKSVSSSAVTTPTQQEALLYCEQRLQSSKSEATLNNKK